MLRLGNHPMLELVHISWLVFLALGEKDAALIILYGTLYLGQRLEPNVCLSHYYGILYSIKLAISMLP